VQALVTLLENALTHGASEAGVDFLVSAEGGILKWEVSDRGKGIPEGLESRLFEKFYRLPGSCPGGIGLGLAIARQFVEVLGGEMRAYNRAEGGASFSVAFPLGEKTLLPT
jgi:two-component system sensor histidine kinase KdpD